MQTSKKRNYLVIGLAAAIVVVVGLLANSLMKNKTEKIPSDAAFYEVYCKFQGDTQGYALIVDSYEAAIGFRDEMVNTEEGVVNCDVKHFKDSNDSRDLFMYAAVSVVNNVTFGFKSDLGYNSYQIQYFREDDSVGALSCVYGNTRYDCFNSVPVDSCPLLSEASEALSTCEKTTGSSNQVAE